MGNRAYITNADNGMYVIGPEWEVAEHIGARYGREGYDLHEFLLVIDQSMPESERIPETIEMFWEVRAGRADRHGIRRVTDRRGELVRFEVESND